MQLGLPLDTEAWLSSELVPFGSRKRSGLLQGFLAADLL